MARTIVYRRSELSEVPEGVPFDNSYWHYFLVLEEDLKQTLRYVQLDEKNMSTFSMEFVKQIICISTEFETIAKLLCTEISGKTPGNIGEYKRIILSRFPKIGSTPVYVDQHTQLVLYPLMAWQGQGEKLEWWEAYTSIKHKRHLEFNNANLKNTLNSMGALLILESYLYKLAYPNHTGIRFGTSLMRVPGLAERAYFPKGTLPDFDK